MLNMGMMMIFGFVVLGGILAFFLLFNGDDEY